MVRDDLGPDLEQVATALYRGRLSDFTAARNRFAHEARAAGQKDVGAAIAGLRKPTVSAWLANLLAAERPDEVAGLLSVGEELRTAQRSLAGEDLRRLSRRRNEVVGALTASARDLAHQRGVSASVAALDELHGTLEAALIDPKAGSDLRRGRLTEPLRYSGLGLESPTAAPVRPGRPGSSRRAKKARSGGSAASSDTDLEERERRRAAEEQLAEAIRELDEKQRQKEEASADLREVRTELARIDTARTRLTAREGQIADRLERAQAELDAAERARRVAASALDRLR